MYYRCQGMRDKETRLAEILNVVTVGQCIVFVHTREAVRPTLPLTSAHALSLILAPALALALALTLAAIAIAS